MRFLRSTLGVLIALILLLSGGAISGQPFLLSLQQAQARSLELARLPSPIKLVSLNQLPPEARKTIALIQQGGPFPYRKDGVIFNNRERRLPPAPTGYYREYTVPTPGSADRGAQRIVTGSQQEFYYTRDHYQSFVKVKL